MFVTGSNQDVVISVIQMNVMSQVLSLMGKDEVEGGNQQLAGEWQRQEWKGELLHY